MSDNDRVFYELAGILPEAQHLSNPELSSTEVNKRLKIRLLQIIDIAWDYTSGDPNIKTLDFIAKLVPIAYRFQTEGVTAEAPTDLEETLMTELSGLSDYE